MEGITSRKDGTTSIRFGTNELLPSLAGDLFSINNKFCYLAIKPELFRDEEKKAIEQLESNQDDTFKSPSQRMRAVLFRMFEQDNKGFKTFTLFYDHHMEQLINQMKSRLQ
jgi:hypothetical protein